jgi:cysteinyl-tRNA synthetase
VAAKFETDFRVALDDDLNAPRACAALFELVHEGNAALDVGAPGAAAALRVLDKAMDVLDVLPTAKTADAGLTRWIEDRIAARDKARKSKDFKEADRIRAELAAKGVEIDDAPSATKWRLV